jgi:hypothetical protein
VVQKPSATQDDSNHSGSTIATLNFVMLHSAILGAAALVLAGVLVMMGRHAWCTCGDLVPWSWDIWTQHNSQHLLDPYFFTHVLHGVILYWALGSFSQRLFTLTERWRWTIMIAVESVWEVIENSLWIINRYRESTMALGYTGDSIANSIFDVVACVLGYCIAAKTGWKTSMLVVVAFELGMLVTIRDSLLLNVIMLIYPIEAIKAWQVP